MFRIASITRRDKPRNADIRKNNTVQENRNYQQKWFKHLNRTQNNRVPKVALQYKTMEKGT